MPTVSTLNYNGDTPNIANAAVVPLGTGGAITFQADATSIDLIIDVNGYYDGSGALQLSLSRRAALDQFWTPQNGTVIGLTAAGAKNLVRSDGADLWVAGDSAVSRVRGSDGKLLGTWTIPGGAFGVLIAMGRVLVTDESAPGQLFGIDPSQPAGAATTLSSNLGNYPAGIAFDGSRVWTANVGGSVSIITPKASPPWTVTTITTGFSIAEGILYDGTNIWVTDNGAGTLLRLDGVGSILQTVAVGAGPGHPTFDGMDIWVPNFYSDSISVVRASTGSVLATLTGNGLSGPIAASFDGQRVMVTDYGGNNVSLWRVAGFAPLGFFGFQGDSQVPNYFPYGVCSDGINFWIALHTVPGRLARF